MSNATALPTSKPLSSMARARALHTESLELWNIMMERGKASKTCYGIVHQLFREAGAPELSNLMAFNELKILADSLSRDAIEQGLLLPKT